MVNWLHEIAPLVLNKKINSYLQINLNLGGLLILDVVLNFEYEFNHQILNLVFPSKYRLHEIGDLHLRRTLYPFHTN